MSKVVEDQGIRSMINFVKNKDKLKPLLDSSDDDDGKSNIELLEQQFISLQMKFISCQSLRNQIFDKFKQLGLLNQYDKAEDNDSTGGQSFIPNLDDLTKVVNHKLLSKLDYLIHLNIQYEKKLLTTQSTKLFSTLEKHLNDQNKLLEKFENCTNFSSTTSSSKSSGGTSKKVSSSTTTTTTKFVTTSTMCTKSIEELHFMMLEEMFKFTMLDNCKNWNHQPTSNHQINQVSNHNYRFPNQDNLTDLTSIDQINKLNEDQLSAYFKFYKLNDKDLSIQQMKEYLLQFLGIGLLA
ncbi:hypothetical protein DFJ63DRAFT_337193 [Scheffersomyces coipomensis]|uniref:uncharacterized protein n=1 Tax=Scheffersomyces coipomensis TaxID=1788519 RepID=UPI00315DAA9F